MFAIRCIAKVISRIICDIEIICDSVTLRDRWKARKIRSQNPFANPFFVRGSSVGVFMSSLLLLQWAPSGATTDAIAPLQASKIILLYGRNFDPLGENSGNVTDAKNINVDRWKIEANPGHLDISSRLSCWFWTDIKEPYPRYVQLFSGTRNFFIFTMCQGEIYVYVG